MSPNHSGGEGFVGAKVFVEALRLAGRAASREVFIDAMGKMRTLLTEDGKVRR